MFQIFLIGAITKVDSVADYPGSGVTVGRYKLGEIAITHDETYGLRFWRYVHNNSGASIAANLGVMQENGTDMFQVVKSSASVAAQRILGVTQHAIADASCGWVLCAGFGLLASDGSTSANKEQKPVANGQFSDGTIGTDTIAAHALAAQAVAASTFLARVNFL